MALPLQRRRLKTHETALVKMPHHISNSLYAVSDKAICRTKTAKVTAHPIEATCAGCCGENLQAASGKQILAMADETCTFISFLFTTIQKAFRNRPMERTFHESFLPRSM